mgnify:CR=1 FL=1
MEGVEPGYTIPKNFLTTLKARYPTASFEQKRMIIYLPSSTTYPLKDDIRNTAAQLKVLLPLTQEEKLAIVMVGFLDRLLPLQELEMLKKTPSLFPLEDGRGVLASQFLVGEGPLICLVNDSGRIVFRSDSLTPVRAEELLRGKISQLTPAATEKELLELMFTSMKEAHSKIERIEKKELGSGQTLYLGFANAEKDEALLVGLSLIHI